MYLKSFYVLLFFSLNSCASHEHQPETNVPRDFYQDPKLNAVYEEIVNDYISSCKTVGSYINKTQSKLATIKTKEEQSNIPADKIDTLISDSDTFIYSYRFICQNTQFISAERYYKGVLLFGEYASKYGRNLESTLKNYPKRIKNLNPSIYTSYREQAVGLSKASDSIVIIIESSSDYYNEAIETNPKIRQHYRANRIELML